MHAWYGIAAWRHGVPPKACSPLVWSLSLHVHGECNSGTVNAIVQTVNAILQTLNAILHCKQVASPIHAWQQQMIAYPSPEETAEDSGAAARSYRWPRRLEVVSFPPTAPACASTSASTSAPLLLPLPPPPPLSPLLLPVSVDSWSGSGCLLRELMCFSSMSCE